MKILMILTSLDQLGDTGKKTGFRLEEFAAPYHVFKAAGADIVLASPKGGQPPLDPTSDAEDAQSDDTRRIKKDSSAISALAHTTQLAEVSGESFDAVMACAADVPTLECLAAVMLLREDVPDIRIRVVNVVDLMALQPPLEHPHGLSDRDFDARCSPQIDRSSSPSTATRHSCTSSRVPRLAGEVDRATTRYWARIERHKLHIAEHGDDLPEVRDWRWQGSV